MFYRPSNVLQLFGMAEEPAAPSPYVAAVSRLLARPTTAFEIAEANLRINNELASYYRAPAIDNTPFVNMSYNTRSDLKLQAESLQASTAVPQAATALQLATKVAILRREADRLQPPRASMVRKLPITAIG